MLAPATPAFRQGRNALLSVIATAEGNTAAGTATVTRLRTALAQVPGHTEVGGNTAQNADFNAAVYGNFPPMLAAIALVTFLLLARTLRSVVLAAKAVVVNIISLGATFGFLVLFWQNGHGSNFIYGVPATGSIRNWIPIITFAFLFGISMDYEVFILARIREEHDRGRSTNDAVIQAVARTGRLVTCAALILARAFRSVVLAGKAVLVNLISLGATFGFLVLFWQNGHGSNLIYGVPATGSIRNWIPIIAFAFLFGISMDYEVFILARMREEYDRTGSTRQAIVGALAHTGRLVTCGALILAISFASLSTAPDIVVEMIATALAFGVLIDAVIVRTLLVPALVAIMGRWNWWMPNAFARLLRLPPAATAEEPAAA